MQVVFLHLKGFKLLSVTLSVWRGTYMFHTAKKSGVRPLKILPRWLSMVPLVCLKLECFDCTIFSEGINISHCTWETCVSANVSSMFWRLITLFAEFLHSMPVKVYAWLKLTVTGQLFFQGENTGSSCIFYIHPVSPDFTYDEWWARVY